MLLDWINCGTIFTIWLLESKIISPKRRADAALIWKKVTPIDCTFEVYRSMCVTGTDFLCTLAGLGGVHWYDTECTAKNVIASN